LASLVNISRNSGREISAGRSALTTTVFSKPFAPSIFAL